MSNQSLAKDQYNKSLRKIMLKVATDSILHGLKHGKALKVDEFNYESALQKTRACFVTLNKNQALRGCIGHLQATQALILDVAENAYAAAFRDPRFPGLEATEYKQLQIHISVLSPAKSMSFNNENELLDKLQPGIDGLIFEEGYNRSTFLPSVWESLPKAENFLNQLKLKAGLPANYWSDTIKISRYTTESFAELET